MLCILECYCLSENSLHFKADRGTVSSNGFSCSLEGTATSIVPEEQLSLARYMSYFCPIVALLNSKCRTLEGFSGESLGDVR